MTALYTDLYGSVPTVGTSSGAVTSTNAVIYKGPAAGHVGQTVTRVGTYTGAIANGDVLHLAGDLVEGERLVSLDISMSGDPDAATATPDIGTTTDTDGILAATALFQAGADITVHSSGQAVPTLEAVAGDEYLLTMTAGAHANSVTYTFAITTTV